MLRIGFSKKYFTLWEVSESEEFEEVDGLFLPYKKINECFIKNLSFDEKTAKRKAIFDGVENFEIYHNCNSKYFLNSKKSIDQLFWEYCQTRKESFKKILLKNGFEERNGQLICANHAKKIKLRDLVIAEISEKDEIDVEILSNIDSNNEFRFSYKNEVFVGIWGGKTKGFIYQGFEYFFPILDGSTRRFKNKLAKLKISNFEAGVYQIEQIKIL